MLYRTNSYNNSTDPFKNLGDSLAYSEFSPEYIYEYYQSMFRNDLNILLKLQNNSNLWLNTGAYIRSMAYQDMFREINTFQYIDHCCWFCQSKESVLSCQKFGRNLHREQGVLRYNDKKSDKPIFSALNEDSYLYGFETEPNLFEDPVNNSLINGKEMIRLQKIEKEHGKQVDIHQKKAVYNVFKRAENGLLRAPKKIQQNVSDIISTAVDVLTLDSILDDLL